MQPFGRVGNPLLWFCVLGLSLSLSSAALAQDALDLTERMTAAERAATGIERLTPQEQAALAAWMQRQLDAERGIVRETLREEVREEVRQEVLPQGDDAFGVEAITSRMAKILDQSQETIESSIEGRFRGWRSKGERFELTNGQVWQMTSAGRFAINVENPDIIIRRGRVGGYYLRVDGYGTEAKVRRVK